MFERLPIEARLWLDDMRPAPVGWTLATSVAEAVYAMERFAVVEASLDHDLGACKPCLAKGGEAAATLHCPHVPDGYAFVRWMAEHGRWPAAKPRVHSLNPSGAAAMRQAIDRHWHPPLPGVAAPCPLDGARVVGILADLERPYVELWRDDAGLLLASWVGIAGAAQRWLVARVTRAAVDALGDGAVSLAEAFTHAGATAWWVVDREGERVVRCHALARTGVAVDLLPIDIMLTRAAWHAAPAPWDLSDAAPEVASP